MKEKKEGRDEIRVSLTIEQKKVIKKEAVHQQRSMSNFLLRCALVEIDIKKLNEGMELNEKKKSIAV